VLHPVSDEMFADLFTEVGRRSVPPMIVAVVMVGQRIEGCSDREAVGRFCFDVRWKYAAGLTVRAPRRGQITGGHPHPHPPVVLPVHLDDPRTLYTQQR